MLTQYFALLSLLLLFVGCWDDKGKRFSIGDVSPDAFSLQQEEGLSSLLFQYVNVDGEVDYEAWLENNADMKLLETLKDSIARADMNAMDQKQKMAFLINAYNLLTLDLILGNYSDTLGNRLSPYPGKRSIKNIKNLDSAVWDQFKWTVSGKRLSLNDIEHKILRPMGDARIHFAVVCASKGCPPLHNEAFSASRLDEDLDRLSAQFINSGRDTSKVGDTLVTSEILKWFEEDFVKSYGSLNAFLRKYANSSLHDVIDNGRIRFKTYDWTLNDSPQIEIPEDEHTGGSGSEQPRPRPTPEVGSGSEDTPAPDLGSSTERPSPGPSPDPGSGSEDGPDVGSSSESYKFKKEAAL